MGPSTIKLSARFCQNHSIRIVSTFSYFAVFIFFLFSCSVSDCSDKLRLNKLSQSITHLFRVKPLPPATCDYPQRVPELLQMLLAALVSPSPTLLQRQNVAKRRLMQVTKQLGSSSGQPIQFFSCDKETE
jgi:hypothetical protein